MNVFLTTTELQFYLEKLPKSDTVGCVPTMGALHLGHKSLLIRALEENSVCICSIFVNPKQFEKKEDLKNYPRSIDADCEMLKSVGCHVLFLPEYKEVYPEGLVIKNYDFGNLDKVMEGVNRPGHFNGVAMVVSRLFEIIQPQKAYFGEKDFQQLAIIKSLAAQKFKNIEIIARSCFKSEPRALPDNMLLLEVNELNKGQKNQVFNGWMFSASPSLNSLEHPIYDIRLLNCRIREI